MTTMEDDVFYKNLRARSSAIYLAEAAYDVTSSVKSMRRRLTFNESALYINPRACAGLQLYSRWPLETEK